MSDHCRIGPDYTFWSYTCIICTQWWTHPNQFERAQINWRTLSFWPISGQCSFGSDCALIMSEDPKLHDAAHIACSFSFAFSMHCHSHSIRWVEDKRWRFFVCTNRYMWRFARNGPFRPSREKDLSDLCGYCSYTEIHILIYIKVEENKALLT